jgi:hypothetical protein
LISLNLNPSLSRCGCEKKAVGCARGWCNKLRRSLVVLRCNLACDIFILSARSHARANGRAPIKKTNYNLRQLKQFEIRVHTRVSGRAQHHLSRAAHRRSHHHRFGIAGESSSSSSSRRGRRRTRISYLHHESRDQDAAAGWGVLF